MANKTAPCLRSLSIDSATGGLYRGSLYDVSVEVFDAKLSQTITRKKRDLSIGDAFAFVNECVNLEKQ